MEKTGRLCVFCGSNYGQRPAYRAAAEELGRELVRRGQGLVFGGGRVGLMGLVADAALAKTDAIDARSSSGRYVRRRNMLENESFINEGISLALHPIVVYEDWPGNP